VPPLANLGAASFQPAVSDQRFNLLVLRAADGSVLIARPRPKVSDYENLISKAPLEVKSFTRKKSCRRIDGTLSLLAQDRKMMRSNSK